MNYKLLGASVLAVILLCTTAASIFFWSRYQDSLAEIAVLSASNEAAQLEIQQQNNEIGLAKSRLLTEDQLNQKYASEIKELKDKLAAVDGAKKVRPVSRDVTVVQVDSTVKGGETTVTVTPEKNQIAYSWDSKDGRFALQDPDIYTQNNETFSYQTTLALKGFILADKTGKLKSRQVTVQEVVKDADGNYQPIESDVKIVQNDFDYVIEQPTKKISDIFNPRLQFQFDTLANPGIAVEIGNVGNYIDWANIGANVQTSIHVADGIEGLQDSAVGVGVSYSLLKPLIDSNISVGVGVLTPVSDLGNRWILNVTLGFYVTN